MKEILTGDDGEFFSSHFSRGEVRVRVNPKYGAVERISGSRGL